MTTLAERMTKRMKEIARERQAKIDRKVKEGWRPTLDKNGKPILAEPRR